MDIDNDNQDQESVKGKERKSTGVGPGERLQAARIEKGLSLKDVAQRMHLSAAILESIEDNNFDEITAPIFVKGYLRAYARIVSLDEDDMILQYIEYYSEEDPPITSTSNMAPELSSKDVRIKWTTYLVILVLAALLAAWWWNNQQNQEVPISLDTQTGNEEQRAEATSESVVSEIEAVSESESMAELESGLASVSESDAMISDNNESAETADPVEAETVASENDGNEPATEAATEAQGDNLQTSAEVSASETATTQDNEFVATRMSPSGSDRLKVIVHADTWADIKDSTGHQLVYDLLRADQSLELTGEAPFSVFLGNAHGVEVRLNDEEFDISSRIRDDNTARLNIGQ